jgi:hypothetical protein
MSLNPPAQIPIPPSTKQNWTDLNRDGRRMDRIMKLCMGKFLNQEISDELRLAYVDRVLKCTEIKHRLAKTVLGVDEVLKEAKSK